MTRTLAVAFAFACALLGHGEAQPSQPIYLQYDGFVKNKDGTRTLSYGYFNSNHADVTIAPGPDNTFAPAPGDRNQPIEFKAGRHRFSCSIVVGPEFDGKLQWTVKFGGVAQMTTAKVFDPLYELERNSERRAIAGLDLAAAKRGVCSNRAPTVAVTNPLADVNAGADGLTATSFRTRIDQELTLNGTVEDDGLPRGSKVTTAWKKNSGPGDVTFSDTKTPLTRVRFSAPGDYELNLSGTDGERTNDVKITVVVSPAPAG